MSLTVIRHVLARLIERLLRKKSVMAYNNVTSWRYVKLPHALGGCR